VKLDGIEGRVALVTGGGRGIGRAIAETLRDQGARVADGDLEAPAIEGVVGVELDVTSHESVDAAFARIEAELGPVELLVLNAGIYVVEPFEETTPESWRRTIDVNLTGAFLTCKHGIRALLAGGGGSVVCTASPTGLSGSAPGISAYSTSKAGVYGLIRVMAAAYGREGIRVNGVIPGYTDTPMNDYVGEEQHRTLVEGIPLGRQGSAEEVAEVMAFLASDRAAYVTGAVWATDGGMTAV
jgi:NAD(P)-dependent dehydrogenase (short-subunit alcohol dehydrogenase family)